MARVRKIRTTPTRARPNYFLVDACFLANKYILIGSAPTSDEKDRLRECRKWWKEIDRQVDAKRARVYIPDICIAESFKVLAKKYYQEGMLTWKEWKEAREALESDVRTPSKTLKSRNRQIRYHDLPATRDIIIAVDRFYELFMKHHKNVGLPDLILVAAAKYLMDFHDAQRSQIHMITLDEALWEGTKKIGELPNAYNPAEKKDAFERVFE